MPSPRAAFPRGPAPDCRRRLAAALTLALSALAPGPASGQTPGEPQPDSVSEGWRVFARKQCIACHAVWGLGGQIGPDLGRTERQELTAGLLAGTMWNHIPKMHSHMLRHHLDYPRLTEQETNDLFSFLLFVPHLDEPGDPAAGRRALDEKGCARCHAIEGGTRRQSAPDLHRWAAYANPIVWAQKMWEHAPQMEQAVSEAGMAWPHLDDADLMNIMAYLRSVGGHSAKTYLQPGSAQTGARLFGERNCNVCHRPGGAGPDLALAPLPRSLAALASRMWNHSPEMTRLMQAQGIERSPLSAQEMADIIAFIHAERSVDHGGDPRRGRALFEAKRCASCHAEDKTDSAGPPAVGTLGAAASPVRLTHAMWNHGLTMLDRIAESGLTWPYFQPGEMVDVIAYLQSLGPPPAPPPSVSVVPLVPIPSPQAPAGPPIEPGTSCASNACHPGIVAGRQVHGPVAYGQCTECHTPVDAKLHRFELVSVRSDLCYRCHEDHGETLAGHGAVAVGVCTACHNPHSAENLLGPNFTGDERCFSDTIALTVSLETLMGRQPGVISAAGLPATTEQPPPAPSERTLPKPDAPRAPTASPPAFLPGHGGQGGCVTSSCHPTIALGRFVHGPVAQQQCETCHVPEGENAHRFRAPPKQPELCYMCHDRLPQTPFTHSPVALGMCTSCHDPHSAPFPKLLTETGNNLCYTCHVEMQDHIKKVRVSHAVVTEQGCAACHTPHGAEVRFQLLKDSAELCLDCHPKVREELNSATVHHGPVLNDKQCANCHNPHGSDVPAILNDVEMSLCLSCHNKPMDTLDGPIIDMAAWIRDNPERHGPIRDANCTGCHQPHGSKNFRILRQAYPREFYSPFSIEHYDLCFQCHEPTLVLDSRTTTLTEFRNGDKNLHYLHVNQEKGRSCRACHETHASTKPKRIRDFVPFGKWEYALNFELTATGGRCAPGCHIPRAYDRRKEIVQP